MIIVWKRFNFLSNPRRKGAPFAYQRKTKTLTQSVPTLLLGGVEVGEAGCGDLVSTSHERAWFWTTKSRHNESLFSSQRSQGAPSAFTLIPWLLQTSSLSEPFPLASRPDACSAERGAGSASAGLGSCCPPPAWPGLRQLAPVSVPGRTSFSLCLEILIHFKKLPAIP